ncbi:MAG: response regulator [Chloroflexota bacterium]|nr:response regulator [Chloroflexota bacterium]
MTSILVVEDEKLIAQLLQSTLELEGYQVVTLRNGEDAVQFALREMPDLIIVDIMLPRMNGYEVIKHLRDHPKTMHIPIIALSALSESKDKVQAFDKDVDGYITKPFDTEELLARVRRQLRRLQQSCLSPLTGLPGGQQVVCAINHQLASPQSWSFLYLDLNNFKSFNDAYGFLSGNEMILLVGQICQQVVYEHGNVDDFVGHVGGDDFVIVTTPDRARTLCRLVAERYKEKSLSLYCVEDRERGSISGVDRKGRPCQIPLVALSIGVVNNAEHKPQTIQEVSYLAAEAKRHAKQSTDNIFYLSSQHSEQPSRQQRSLYPHNPSPLSAANYTYQDFLGSTKRNMVVELEQQIY